jgi:hypothetical protein
MIGSVIRHLLFRRAESAAGPRTAAFARGLALGALVGAAIAGSGLWSWLTRPRRD